MTDIRQWLTANADLPRLECELLLGNALGFDRAQIIAHPEHAISEQALNLLAPMVQRLREGSPLAYILGEVEFWDLTLEVSPDVLIPRPETELLVELTLNLASRGAKVLDLGTGSGAIALALAHERADLLVCATDLSAGALQVARSNALANGLDIEFVQGSWFEPFEAGRTWEVILSNPPYIAAGDPHLQDLTCEPTNALVADNQGLADIATIVAQSAKHLQSGGHLLIEHGYDQAEAVQSLLRQTGYKGVRSYNDLAGIARATTGSL